QRAAGQRDSLRQLAGRRPGRGGREGRSIEARISWPLMTQRAQRQKRPADWAAREALREKGQFWTPRWVAEAMVAYCLADGAESVFDPAVGAGAFFIAAKEMARKKRRRINLFGAELDRDALQIGRAWGG